MTPLFPTRRPWLALLLLAPLLAGVVMAGAPASNPEADAILAAIKNTRRNNNFRITASIKGPESEIPIQADFRGRDFQITTQEGVLRDVGGDCWITRDLGKTWAPTEPEKWILLVILTPMQPDPGGGPYEFLGTEQQDGHTLRHYRLKVPDGDGSYKGDLPQIWLVKGDKDEWFIWRAKCPVMVKDGAFPMVDVKVSEIDKIGEIKVPKGMSPSIRPSDLLKTQ